MLNYENNPGDPKEDNHHTYARTNSSNRVTFSTARIGKVVHDSTSHNTGTISAKGDDGADEICWEKSTINTNAAGTVFTDFVKLGTVFDNTTGTDNVSDNYATYNDLMLSSRVYTIRAVKCDC